MEKLNLLEEKVVKVFKQDYLLFLEEGVEHFPRYKESKDIMTNILELDEKDVQELEQTIRNGMDKEQVTFKTFDDEGLVIDETDYEGIIVPRGDGSSLGSLVRHDGKSILVAEYSGGWEIKSSHWWDSPESCLKRTLVQDILLEIYPHEYVCYEDDDKCEFRRTILENEDIFILTSLQYSQHLSIKSKKRKGVKGGFYPKHFEKVVKFLMDNFSANELINLEENDSREKVEEILQDLKENKKMEFIGEDNERNGILILNGDIYSVAWGEVVRTDVEYIVNHMLYDELQRIIQKYDHILNRNR